MQITKLENKLAIQCYYNPAIINRIKNCPDRIWNKEKRQWETPLSSLRWLREEFPEARYSNLGAELREIAESLLKHQEVASGFNSFIPHPKLYDYQWDTIQKALQSKTGYLIYLDMGLGKSFISLELIRYFKEHGIIPALVICPLILIKNAWFNDVNKFYNDLKIISLRDAKLGIPLGYDIYCINYEMLPKWIEQLKAFGFKILVIDESSRIKDNRRKVTKNVLNLGKNIPYKYCLSGTPAPNNEMEYHGQIKLVGATEDNFYKWRSKWFYQTGFMGYDWKLRRSLKEQFYEQFKEKAIFLKKEQCLNLPEKIFISFQVDLSQEEKDTYDLMKVEVIRLLNDECLTITNALSIISKLRQVVSGFCYREGETIWEAKKPSKIEVLDELLEEINPQQVIIGIQFDEEKKHIFKHFSDIYKIGFVTGKESNKEKDQAIKNFINGNTQILVGNLKSLSHGLTFVNCNYFIYYSRSFSYEEYNQSQDRIHREGQTKKCFYYVLHTDTWIDQRINGVLEGKEKLSLELLRNIKCPK